MSKAIYWQKGESLDFKNATEAIIPADTIISLATRIGVAGNDIGINEIGSLHVVGVFEMPKKEGDVIEIGAAVYFDGEQITITADSNTPAGYAVKVASEEETKVFVKLLG